LVMLKKLYVVRSFPDRHWALPCCHSAITLARAM
jgi:hypothetical protein